LVENEVALAITGLVEAAFRCADLVKEINQGMNMKRGRRRKRVVDLHNPQKNRSVYLLIYHRMLDVLRMGGDREEALSWLQRTMSQYDIYGLDDYELENFDSIRSRGLADALEGRSPCPIWGLWGDDEPEHARE
jgi:hypothetical protein